MDEKFNCLGGVTDNNNNNDNVSHLDLLVFGWSFVIMYF